MHLGNLPGASAVKCHEQGSRMFGDLHRVMVPTATRVATTDAPNKTVALKTAEFPIKLRSIMMKQTDRLGMVSRLHI